MSYLRFLIVLALILNLSCKKDAKIEGLFHDLGGKEKTKSCNIYNFSLDTLSILNFRNGDINKFRIRKITDDKIFFENDKISKSFGYIKTNNEFVLYLSKEIDSSNNIRFLTPLKLKEVDTIFLKQQWKGDANQLREEVFNHWFYFLDNNLLLTFAKFKGINMPISSMPNAQYEILDFEGLISLYISNGERYIVEELKSDTMILNYLNCDDGSVKRITHQLNTSENKLKKTTWEKLKGEKIYDLPDRIIFENDSMIVMNRKGMQFKDTLKCKYFLGPENTLLFSYIFDPISIQKNVKDTLILSKWNPISKDERALYIRVNRDQEIK